MILLPSEAVAPQNDVSKFQLSCLVQFFAVDIEDHVSSTFPYNDNTNLVTDIQRHRHQIFNYLRRLLRLDCSKENDIVTFYQILPAVMASEISDLAVDVQSEDDAEAQLCKIYANLLLMTLYCCSYVIAETFRGRMTQKILGELKRQKIEISAGRDRERRKALKHACFLLEAYDRLMTLDNADISKNWDRVYCAWYAGCIVEIAGFLAREREMAELRLKLDHFKQVEKAQRRNHLYTLKDTRKSKQSIRRGHNRKSSRAPRNGASTDMIRVSPLRQRISLYTPQSAEEVSAWQAYRDVTANMMNRSSTAPIIWYNLIPQMARRYPSVRYALMSTAESCKASLVINDNETELRQQFESSSMKWLSEAFIAQRRSDQPKSAILLMALLLSCNELQAGHVREAFIHIMGAFQLSKDQQEDTLEAKTAASYCKTFMQCLTEVQDPREPKNKAQRLSQAISSLEHATEIFDDAGKRADRADIPESERISNILQRSRKEMELILPKWRNKLAVEVGGRQMQNYVQESHNDHILPWKSAMKQLNEYLNDGKPFSIKEFEIAMERTIPIYGLSKSGEDDDMRADVAELMMLGPALRGKRVATVPVDVAAPTLSVH